MSGPEGAPEGERRIVYGVRPVAELVTAQPRAVAVVYVAQGPLSDELAQVVRAARDRGIAVQTRPRAVVADLAGARAHQGVVAIAGAYRYVEVETILGAARARGEAPLLLLLDGLTDPQNLGALIRSAEVLGAHGVVLPARGSAPVAGGAVKASAGASERLPVARVESLLRAIDRLREAGVAVWGAAGGGGSAPHALDLRAPVAFIIGSEGRGLREAVARRCTGAVAIPMRGQIASLNASAAGAILLYEAMRQRAS